MKIVIGIIISILISYPYFGYAESVYKCEENGRAKYQSSPCTKDNSETKINLHGFKPDPITLERLDKQRMEFLRWSDPPEFN